jgi:polyisoprenoid-binding protein YceI
MKGPLRILFAVSVASAHAFPGVPVAHAQTTYVLDRSASHVTFRGRAFIKSITGFSTSLHGAVVVRQGNLASIRGDVRFPIASLKTNPSLRPRELLEMFGAEGGPEIVFQVDSIGLRGEGDCAVHGKLTMNGLSRDVTFVGQTRTRKGRVLTEGSSRVDLRQWQIQMPRRFGLRMAHDITLSFRAEFRRPGAHHTALVPPDEDDSR